jgi:tetratricopeptide (TPR) repeat protein
MSKGIVALAGLLALSLAASPGAAGQDAREVRVRLLADEEVRAKADWPGRIAWLVEAASGGFGRAFGLRLKVVSVGEWASDDSLDSLELLLEALDATAVKEGADVLLALTAQRNLGRGALGFSLFKEGQMLLRLSDEEPGLERLLRHEWGHMFGAAHVADPTSIMHRMLGGEAFDALNARLIRLCRDRTFNGIDLPIPREARREAVEIYRALADLNLETASRHPGNVTIAPGVEVSRSHLAVIDERGRNEMYLLDDAHVLLAQVHLEEKEYDLALEACRAALRIDPDNLETHNLVGIIARRQGRIEEALAQYSLILDKKPRSARFLYNQAIALAKKGETGEALGLYRRAVELKPNFAEAWNNIGELALRADRVDEAEAAFRKAASLNAAFALAHSNLAEVFVRKGAFAEAEAELTRALAANPDLPGPYNVRGNLHYQQGRTPLAREQYEKALTLDPGYEKAHYNLGLCAIDEGRLDEALARFAKAIELAPELAEAHAGLGYGLLKAGRVEESLAELGRAQELGLVSAKTHLNLSYAYLLKDRLDEAVVEARRALELEPDLAVAHNNLGVAAMKRGKPDEAARAFERALELDPRSKEALVNLAGLRSVADKRREALDLYLRAAEVDPKDGVLHNNVAVLYFRLGSYAEAWDYAQKALALGAKVDPGFLKELGEKRRRGSRPPAR